MKNKSRLGFYGNDIAKGLASLRTLYANITNQKHCSNEKKQFIYIL
jgi:hypothetical protein